MPLVLALDLGGRGRWIPGVPGQPGLQDCCTEKPCLQKPEEEKIQKPNQNKKEATGSTQPAQIITAPGLLYRETLSQSNNKQAKTPTKTIEASWFFCITVLTFD